MQAINIRFKNLAVSKIDNGHKSLDLTFNYLVNGNPYSLTKRYVLTDGSINFVKGVMNEIKKGVREKFSKHSDDIIEGIVTIIFGERELGETEEKLVNGIQRIKSKLNDFKRTSYSGDYLNKFNELNSMIIDIK